MTATSRSSSDAIEPALRYRDLDAAAEWLCAMFDFELHSETRGQDGRLEFVELSCGGGTVLLGAADDAETDQPEAQPDAIDGPKLQSCYVLVEDINALRVKAKQAKLNIVFDIKADKFVGRSFGCKDLEGNIWYFGSRTSDEASGEIIWQPHRKRRIGARSIANLAAGVLVATIGSLVWLYVNSDSVDGQIASPVDEPAETMRAEVSKGAPVPPLATQDASEGAPALPKMVREALQNREIAIREARKKLATDRGNHHPAEPPARAATTTNQRVAPAEDVSEFAEATDQVERKTDETHAASTLKAEHSSNDPVPQLVGLRQVDDDKEGGTVEPRAGDETAKTAVNEKTRPIAPNRQAQRVAAATVRLTEPQFAAESHRPTAVQPAIVSQAAAVAVGMERRTPNSARPGATSGETTLGTRRVVPESPAKFPTVKIKLTVPSPKTDADETAKGTLLQSRRKAAAPPLQSRVEPTTPEKKKAPVPLAKPKTSKAIENARRLAEKLRARRSKSQQEKLSQSSVEAERAGNTRNQEQRDEADSGLAKDKATKPEEILRRAFISKW